MKGQPEKRYGIFSLLSFFIRIPVLIIFSLIAVIVDF